MAKRILLAEESETIKKIAESLLRQNGFEVLSMNSGTKALEVLNFTSPDLILLAADMMFKGNTSLFDKLHSDPKMSQIPIVLLANENQSNLPLPPEAIITKPFNPKEFIEKVNLFSGKPHVEPLNPLGTNDIEDEFLDAALGIDSLEVTNSEVLDQTLSGKLKIKQSEDNMIGFEQKQDTTDITDNSSKIESLMLNEDVTDIKQSQKIKATTPQDITGTGKLDILDDQFGMVGKDNTQNSNADSDHDYNWFLDELANDNNDVSHSHKKQSKKDQVSQSLKFEDTSSFVDPITPVKSTLQTDKPTSVDKFIDEFKKEVEKIGSDEPESITIKEAEQKFSKSGSILQWTDSIEKITPQHIELFKNEFVAELADKLAIQIAGKIDSDKLLSMLKQEIINKFKKI